MDLGLKNKVVVITGGSNGIGLGAAYKFAEEGARLFLCARGHAELFRAAGQISAATGATVEIFVADVTSTQDVSALRNAVLERYGRIDVLVNNVGTGIYKPFLEITEDDLLTGMALNFFSQFRVSQHFVPMMIKQGSGNIVNVAGCSGMQVLDPPFFSTCTGPAKAAEIRFTKALAAEIGQYNIRVNCVAPNFVDVPERVEKWINHMNSTDLSTEELKANWARRVVLPGHPWGTVNDVANTIAFAASDATGYTTGEVFVVDGGFCRD